jgi:uncharacterized SAM-dependent methyltransferase
MLRFGIGRQLHSAEIAPAFRQCGQEASVQPSASAARGLQDRSASALFDMAAGLFGYCPNRTARTVLAYAATEIAVLTGPGRAVMKIGSGLSGTAYNLTTHLLWSRLPQRRLVPNPHLAASTGSSMEMARPCMLPP